MDGKTLRLGLEDLWLQSPWNSLQFGDRDRNELN